MPSLIGTTVTANYLKNVRSNGTNGRTLVLKLAGTDITDANLNSVIGYLTTAHGISGSGDSAFTVAGIATASGAAFVSGTTDTLFILAQGTGDVTVGDLDMGISGLTITVEAVFQDNYL
jgi:hypothetical protein